MHVQVVNFHLKGMDDAAFRAMCDQLAPALEHTPGMYAKIWLADPATNTYGGIYTWRDRQAMDDYGRSDFFKAVQSHPNLADITSRDYDVLEGPTAVTHGLPYARV
jgi:quinol monooxygenase YgiN